MRQFFIRGMLLSILVILACARICTAGEKEIGLKVGENIPEFRLSDQSGKNLSFNDLCGSKGLVFIFYRSANW